MTTIKSKAQQSRRDARLKMKIKFPLLINDSVHVHHKDFNPLNNRLDNLKILPQGEHIRLHSNLYWDHQQLKKLESLLIIGNTFGY